MAKQNTSVNITILGSKWTIKYLDEDPLFENAQGYTIGPTREIVIENIKFNSDDPMVFDLNAQNINQKRVLRHEIIHAYLEECGLAENSSETEAWATNEEMIDWFARIGPKIFETYKELNIL